MHAVAVAAATALALSATPPTAAAGDQYRTKADQLYICGASTSPGGRVHRACGYNAFQAITVDLRLPSAAPAL